MTERELEEFIQHGEKHLALNAHMWGYGWAVQAVEIAKTLRERLNRNEPKPVAWMDRDVLERFKDDRDDVTTRVSVYKCINDIPLYTAPQKREWQGLTDEEIYTIAEDDEIDWPAGGTLTFARLIEARLKENNA